MFQSTRIKLTLWYLLIILGISVFFSVMIYRQVSLDLERRFIVTELRFRVPGMGMRLPRRLPDNLRDLNSQYGEIIPEILEGEELQIAKNNLRNNLLTLNMFILGLSAFFGYILAGKTLKPIEDTLERQKRFVADASHELKTPLTGLKTNIEVSLRDKKLGLKEAKNVLTESLSDINKLQSLTNHLLLLANGNGMTKETFAIKGIVTDVVGEFKKQAKTKKIKILTSLDDFSVLANKTRIEELIRILLDNAVKYTPKGGSISLELTNSGKYALLRVSDTGPGISKKDIPFIFDRFYRVDKSRSNHDVEGYGLGLAIARKIVNEHKGSIEVKSELAKGSTFEVRLPRT